jgi:hypothetical protein
MEVPPKYWDSIATVHNAVEYIKRKLFASYLSVQLKNMHADEDVCLDRPKSNIRNLFNSSVV